MKQLDVTLCLIVKDEEEYVETCIKSVKSFAKNILIADTGSTDQTISICRRHTDNVQEIDFSKGFSSARNHLLRQVDTQWVLFLDADEYFDAHELDKLSQLLSKVSLEVDAIRFLRYNFFSNGAFYTSETIKLFRNHPDIFYTGVVVDSVKPSLVRRGGHILDIPVILNHFGHCRPISVRNKKSEKYLDMIEEELVQDPDNFKVMGYKALILRTLGRLDEAYKWGEQALSIAPKEGHPHFVMGHIDRALGRHDRAVNAYSRAIELDGENATYLNSRGVSNLTNGKLDEAERDFYLGSSLFPHQIHFIINQGLVDQARGNYKKAIERFEEVAQKYPAFLKENFESCTEVDPHSGYMYDTIFNYHGLAYHLSYCKPKISGFNG